MSADFSDNDYSMVDVELPSSQQMPDPYLPPDEVTLVTFHETGIAADDLSDNRHLSDSTLTYGSMMGRYGGTVPDDDDVEELLPRLPPETEFDPASDFDDGLDALTTTASVLLTPKKIL